LAEAQPAAARLEPPQVSPCSKISNLRHKPLPQPQSETQEIRKRAATDLPPYPPQNSDAIYTVSVAE
jgi:hypothetical protein